MEEGRLMADPTETPETDASTVVASRRYVLLDDADGFAIWRLDRDDDEPVAEFPPTDDGLDDALARWEALRKDERRAGVLTALAWAVGVMGTTWIVFTAVVVTYGLALTFASERERNDGLSWFFSFTYQVFAVLPPAFLAVTGLYVVLWMHFRRRDL
jgi:hypothetical protein